MSVERRFLTTEFRVSPTGEPATIGGYAAVFDSNSFDMGFTEVVDPHAFDSVMASSPNVVCLWNHNPDVILGRTTSQTLSLSLDSRGLLYECQLPDTTAAKDLAVSMRRKDVTGSSFSFTVRRDQWTDNTDGTITRRILEFDELLDVSPVVFPAYAASSTGIRSLPESMPVEMRSRIEKRSPLTQNCTCPCPQCLNQACGICSADPQCEGVEGRSKPQDQTSSHDLKIEDFHRRMAVLALFE